MSNRFTLSRWPAVAAAVVLALGIWSALTTRFQTELIPLFPAGLPSVQALQALETNVSENEVFLVPVDRDAAPPELLEKVSAALRRQPGVAGVEISPAPPIDTARLVAARLAALASDRFATLNGLLGDPSAMGARLEQTQSDFLGAPDPNVLVARRIDPLRLLELVPGSSVTTNFDMGGLPPAGAGKD